MYWCNTKKTWVISWADPIRKGKSIYRRMPKGTTKEFAKRQETKARAGLTQGVNHKSEKTFSEWSTRWIEQYARIHKTPSSVVKDHSTLQNHLLPRFGDWYITSVSVTEVHRLQSELLERNLAPQTINNIVACLSMVLNFATSNGAIDFNPCKLVKRIKVHSKSPTFWSFEEVERFMAFCRQKDYQTFQMVGFALTTGLRPGEIQGLLRDCLDFETGFVYVRRNYCTKTHKIVEYTKTKRDRQVPIPSHLLAILKDKYHLKPLERVFPISVNSFGKRKIQKLALECGVTPIRFHDLRHTFASHLAIKNVHQVKIRDLLGHTKLDTTNVYMHLSKNDKKGLTDILTENSSWAQNVKREDNVVSLFN